MTKTSGYNIAVGLIVAVGSFTYGFGFASFATSIGQPGFFAYFGLSLTGPNAAYTNHIIGAVNALFFFGACVGAIGGGPTADKIGRKQSLFTASLIAIIGGALTAGSVHVAMLIVVRILQGIGLGALATLVPIYLSEASTPSKRGMLTGLHGFFLVSGYNVSAWVGFGCFFSDNLTFGWRGPIAFTCIPPLILFIGCFWIPESPRWLLTKNRVEEAWAVLSKLHHDPNDPDGVAAHEEFYQMRKQIELESVNPTGYKAIFSTPAYRKRVFLSCFVQYAANATGGLVINYYSVIIYENLGLHTYLPLLMYCIYTLIGALGNLFSLLTIDKTGRRPALLTGFTGCLVCVVIEAAMVGAYVQTPTPNIAGQKVAIVAIMFFVFFYGLFIDAASFIYSAEILPTNIRSSGVAMATFTYFAACITFVTPGATAIANIGYKYFVIFACLTVVSIAVIYFMYPETKGKSLEELAELFGDPVVVHLTNATDEEKQKMDMQIKNELIAEHQKGVVT
ncbi:general substrate transporter [Aaosphaeria arxii CBS 175.79]|uniref:General substrate transporter n=1 Tax=Aaosphaeria arxii CBS 175.79 TaxID=1450172 RepID=A0A6A5XVC7_9PLEO|nr:general substrate transporter [Aaosphaeria arxii CBS 175.79]KAF2016671.1 general substrate transporter [Aaosphaeria arxii CBS 175.79]